MTAELELPEGWTPLGPEWKPKNVNAKGLAKLLARMAKDDKRSCLIGTAQQTGWVTDKRFLLRATVADASEIAKLTPRADGRIITGIPDIIAPARYCPVGSVIGMRLQLKPESWRSTPGASAFLLVRSPAIGYPQQDYAINGDYHHLVMLRYPDAVLRLQPRTPYGVRPVFYVAPDGVVVGAVHPLDGV